MPSYRQIRSIGLILLLALCVYFYYSNAASSEEYRFRTVTALGRKEASESHASPGGSMIGPISKEDAPEDDISSLASYESKQQQGSPAQIAKPSEDSHAKPRLKKASANDRPIHDQDEGKTVAGRKIVGGSDGQQAQGQRSSGMSEKPNIDVEGLQSPLGEPSKSDDDRLVEQEVNSILRRGPIIIFSKSYCPYSAKAKKILLEKYNIVPPPYVVELDQHRFGRQMQITLEKMTGRRTVPNILVNGKSVGGGDDIEALDHKAVLIDKFREMGGKRLLEIGVKGPIR